VGVGLFTKLYLEGHFMTDENRRPEKKAYQSPRLTVISLRPDEAVLGHCKNASSAGPVGASCNALSCNVSGS
jgi:hypothetical protein